MHLRLFLLLIIINLCHSFFNNPPFQLNKLSNRYNLTCASDFDDTDVSTDCEYCVYEFFNNGTDSVIYHDCIYITNTYRLVTQRCTGFTNASDIGYGVCTQLPFEYFDINLLCICATNLCNENFTTCKQSVDSNPNLPVLSSPIPILNAESSAITCEDTPLGILQSTYYCIRDSTPFIDMGQCNEYVQNHTVVCMYLESDSGNYLTVVALPDEDYEYVLAEQIILMERMAVKPNTQQYYNETTDAFYLQWIEQLQDPNNYTLISNKCYCTIDNCNANLTACLEAGTKVNMANKGKNIFLSLVIMEIFWSSFLATYNVLYSLFAVVITAIIFLF
jgi:hypothetical protein